MGSRKDRKLKNYFLKNDLQMRMISASVVYMVVVVFFMLAVVLFPVIEKMMLADDIDTRYFAAQTFLLMTRRLLPALVVMLVAIFVHQLVLSHRICGPLVNFTHTFRRIGQGDLTRKIHLRHGDYLKKECDRINEMIDGFSGLIDRIRGDNTRLVALLEDVVSHIEDLDTRKKTEETLAALKENADQVQADLAVFKLSETEAAGEPEQKA